MIECIEVAGSAVRICKIGFGCARIHGGSETKASARLIEAALSAGIRHFDTAPMYGDGQSEDVLGQVLRGAPDITLTTKVGIPRPGPETARRPTAVAFRRIVNPWLRHAPRLKSQLRKLRAGLRNENPGPEMPRRKLEGSRVRFELAESLKRLKRDYVDLYLVHEPDQFELDDEALETFTSLQREGLVGAFGLAYGRCVDQAPDFGTVVQSQYRHECSSRMGRKTQIFHGVLRYGWNPNSETDHPSGLGRYIIDVFEAFPGAGIVFSATYVHQIKQVTEALKAAGSMTLS